MSGINRVAVAAVLAAMALVVLDAAIVNVALPTVAASLQLPPAQAVLVVTAYQLGLVMALLPCAALGESLGYRCVFVAGVALFALASAAGALAPSFAWLVAARLLQGLGGAAVMALGITLLRQIVMPARLGAAIGWNALTVGLAAAAGPALGAYLLSVLPWQVLFILNLPVGMLVLLLSLALPCAAGNGRQVDAVSATLNAASFGGVVIGVQLLPAWPALAILLLLGAMAALVLLIRRELPREAPLIPFDLLRLRSFRVSATASLCCFAGQTAALIALPFYLQHGLHQSAKLTGLMLTPWPLAVALAAPVVGRLAEHLPGAWLCAAGGVTLATGLAATALWPLHGDPLALVPFILLCGFGFGLFQVPNNRGMFLTAPPARSGAAGGMQGTARLAGQAAGAVAMTLLFTLLPPGLAPRFGLALGAALTLAAGLVSLLRLPKGRNGGPGGT
ncbi:MFS transporter [Ferrovibrio sp.]|uniref:MFS transporter n=1 Tax=Ferrovibrio sp. TaxID=1917215 RepID=UPI003D2A0987